MPRTLEEVQEDLDEWRAALRALRFGQSYSQGDRTLTRGDLPEVRRHVNMLSREVTELTATRDGANSSMFVTPSWQ